MKSTAMCAALFLCLAAVSAAPDVWGAAGPDPPVDTCLRIETEEAAAQELQIAGFPVVGYTFQRAVIPRLFAAIRQAQQVPGAPSLGPQTTHITVAATETVMAIHYLDRIDVLLLFYGADGCRITQGELPVVTWEAAMCIGGFRDCRPGAPI